MFSSHALNWAALMQHDFSSAPFGIYFYGVYRLKTGGITFYTALETKIYTLGETIVIKGVDKDAYRRLKARAAKEGLKIGEAASLAFMEWGLRKSHERVRDMVRVRMGLKMMDDNRSKLREDKDWSSVEVIRAWRQKRRI